MKRRLAMGYLAAGVGVSIVSTKVLLDEGKESASKIAYYATMNGLLWPVFLAVAFRKSTEFNQANGDVWRDSVGD